MDEDKDVFNKGDKVGEKGHYVCVPCGYKKEYEAGDVFGECTSCLAGTDEGTDEYMEGTSLWEKSTEEKSE